MEKRMAELEIEKESKEVELREVRMQAMQTRGY